MHVIAVAAVVILVYTALVLAINFVGLTTNLVSTDSKFLEFIVKCLGPVILIGYAGGVIIMVVVSIIIGALMDPLAPIRKQPPNPD